MGGEFEYSDQYYSGKSTDTLVVSYGRLADNITEIDGTDSLLLLKIFPIPEEALHIASRYKKVYFFEEGIKSGGIGEKFLLELYGKGFRGEYELTAIEGHVSAADVETQLKKLGLDRDGIIRKLNEKQT
jgi:1-deoxy-D-xylulose-5-phosphate synthase